MSAVSPRLECTMGLCSDGYFRSSTGTRRSRWRTVPSSESTCYWTERRSVSQILFTNLWSASLELKTSLTHLDPLQQPRISLKEIKDQIYWTQKSFNELKDQSHWLQISLNGINGPDQLTSPTAAVGLKSSLTHFRSIWAIPDQPPWNQRPASLTSEQC